MLNLGSQVGEDYTILFSLRTGSSVSARLYVDGTLDQGLVFANLFGKSSLYSAESHPKVHSILIQTNNLVSCAELNSSFEISTRILSPILTLEPLGPTYLYPIQLYLKIYLQSGSNVKLSLDMDTASGVSLLKNNKINITTKGTWSENTINQVNILTYESCFLDLKRNLFYPRL